MNNEHISPITIALASGVAAIAVKLGRVLSPEHFNGPLAGVLPSALTQVALSWAVLAFRWPKRVSRSVIAGLVAGGVGYELQQINIQGRTFDWLDLLVGVIACVPAFVQAERYSVVGTSDSTVGPGGSSSGHR